MILVQAGLQGDRRTSEIVTHHPADPLNDLGNRIVPSGSKVVNLSRLDLRSGQVNPPSHIPDLDEGPNHPASSVKLDRLSQFKMDDRAGDDLKQLLARPVDVGRADDRRWETVSTEQRL